jgi:Trypsin-co-occurring domain 1
LDEVTLDLALSFGVEGGVVVAKGSAQAEASVTLTWKGAQGKAAANGA